MKKLMEGIRVLEVAEQTFVPAASALLADWGAEVIKIEHVTRGDAMRGLASTGSGLVPKDVHVLLEHSNRGKRSIGLDLASSEGVALLYRLAAESDIFLTNKLPGVRSRLKIDLADIRAQNPNIIYVRGTGQGERGPDADKGSYDNLAFWNRSGAAMGVMSPDDDRVPPPPGPAFGDSLGAMTIAGGMAAALFHRERTGEAAVVDVSLLATGMWAMGGAIGLSAVTGERWSAMPAGASSGNPLVRNYLAKDGRWLVLNCLQAGKYWAPLCDAIGRPELAVDPRFMDHNSIMSHNREIAELLDEVFAQRTISDWRVALEGFVGQWTVVQDTVEILQDVQTIANGYTQPCETASGVPFVLVAAPVQFDEQPSSPGRAPTFNEHGDDILAELGLEWDTILDLKVKGVVA